ncbi:MAG TPA: right-handed parallel beta-helix repeat-containing protein [Ideonella sp.]|uniref:right-handed parallel beta-helix repeat-containing protein n=1 Tax=Ideonella sp. TaxID=1929293 RepID=UPI002BE63AF3|nr:right-handed parallel beta-helix repeat-containing protein [Ideonella sp.]HSI47043.1 right-handed parallel beta-helix repeat-containing protein [Ideonella sp.]
MQSNHGVVVLALAVSLFAGAGRAATIQVPQDWATIQAGIHHASKGDTVLVAPGTYYEGIDFKGKTITVISSGGPEVTIIDAGHQLPVAQFHAGETRQSMLSGFTLQNGFGDYGGGVYISGASPTIQNNIIQANFACEGNGVAAMFSSALISRNKIRNNQQSGCSGGTFGGGVLIQGSGGVEVSDNTIENNYTEYGGGGIGLFAAGSVTIARNVIRFNSTSYQGGGIATVNDVNMVFVDNVIYGNKSGQGGGISLSIPSGSQGGNFVNNTVVDNTANEGSEIYTEGFAHAVQFTNNIFRTTIGSSGLFCDAGYEAISPVFLSNDVFASNGAQTGGICASAAGQGGNIAVDPKFAGGSKAKAYQLAADSPAIDAGRKNATAGKKDLLGNPRVMDGNGDSVKAVDMGAFERQTP